MGKGPSVGGLRAVTLLEAGTGVGWGAWGFTVVGAHLVEGDLQHDGQGQVAVEQRHTVREAQALSRLRRRRQQ